MSSEVFLETKVFSDDINKIPKEHYMTSFPLHWHKYIEIVFVPEDVPEDITAIIALNNTSYSMKRGDVLFIWPGEVHGTLECTPNSLYCIQFSPSILEEQKDFIPFISFLRNYHLITPEEFPELAVNINGCFNHMYWLNSDKDSFYNTRMVITLYEMFMHFCLQIKDSLKDELGVSTLEAGKTFKSITSACKFIQENCEHQLTLSDVAEHVGFSNFYMSRIFKKITGSNFVEYLTMQRIKKAQILLTDSEVTITDVAYRSGFTSISTFNRVFKNYRGCSPSDYRKYYIIHG